MFRQSGRTTPGKTGLQARLQDWRPFAPLPQRFRPVADGWPKGVKGTVVFPIHQPRSAAASLVLPAKAGENPPVSVGKCWQLGKTPSFRRA